MCTVTIVPYDDGFRLVCNRDERLDRPKAIPPDVRFLRDRAATFPIDPEGGGTWIGVNDNGLVATLLNRNDDSAPWSSMSGRVTRSFRSRGVIVPRILNCSSLVDAIELAATLDPAQFNPFRLVIVQRMAAAILTSDGEVLSAGTATLLRPRMLTSSSLGDAKVAGPRRRLFERMLLRSESDWESDQARFHAHWWPSRRDISVMMERTDARTVSQTVITVTSRGIDVGYDALGSRTQRARRAA